MDLQQRMGVDWSLLRSDVLECRTDRISDYALAAITAENSNYRIVQRSIQDYLLQQAYPSLF